MQGGRSGISLHGNQLSGLMSLPWTFQGKELNFNSHVAAEAAGLTKETPEVEGGRIYRDSNGDFTGLLASALYPHLRFYRTPMKIMVSLKTITVAVVCC